MNKIILSIILLLSALSALAQTKVVQDGTMQGPFPMGKEDYPSVEGKVLKSATKVFVSTAGIAVRDIMLDIPDLLVKENKVVGGYDLWLDPSGLKKKSLNLTITTDDGQSVAVKLSTKENRLKKDKKYIVNLTTQGTDPNEGFAYLIVKAQTASRINIVGGTLNQSYEVKPSASTMIKLPYGRYEVTDAQGGVHHVVLKDRPVILSI